MRVLVLGGTGEARALAADLVAAGVDVISSLAGRVSRPALPVGDVRIGGFGGAHGLAGYLREEQIGRVVDATHPFAATITTNAVGACRASGIELLLVRRPEWQPRQGDRWIRVPDIITAAAAVRDSAPGTVLLTTGRRDLAAFAADDLHAFVVRTVDPPDTAMPPTSVLLLDRGPYDVAGETELMRAHDIALLVTKNSGGPLTAAKLTAARDLGIPVVVVDRPPVPEGVTAVENVAEALGWALQAG